MLQSVDSSGVTSPSYEKKHIHFNEQVEQCIALDMSEGKDEEVDAYQYAINDNSDSDSDGGMVMMKRSNSKKLLPTPGGLSSGSKRSTRNNSFVNGESKTIAMLPSTTLKYREEETEPKETAQKHSSGWFSSPISPSGSTDTLRPSKPSSRGFLLGDDSDDEDFDWEPPTHSAFANRKDSISVAQERMGGLSISNEGGPSSSGMRRTPSGMFMPTSESDDEDAAVNEGLFGKVVDTVNTAKDIAHVIWNVGWRR